MHSHVYVRRAGYTLGFVPLSSDFFNLLITGVHTSCLILFSSVYSSIIIM